MYDIQAALGSVDYPGLSWILENCELVIGLTPAGERADLPAGSFSVLSLKREAHDFQSWRESAQRFPDFAV